MLKSAPMGAHSLPPCTTGRMGSVMTHSTILIHSLGQLPTMAVYRRYITCAICSAISFHFCVEYAR